MEQPLYRLIELTARENGFLDPVLEWKPEILAVLAVVGLLTCFIGFYMYRVLNGGLTFLLIAWLGRMWLEPLWGARTTVTFIAVIGVTAAFLAFRWYRLGAVTLCAAIAASWAWQLIWGTDAQLVLKIAAVVVSALAAGEIAFLFPLWGVSSFTAIWGGITFAQLASYLLPFMPQEGAALCLIPALVLIPCGAAAQYFLFKNQKVLPRIMPKKMEYKLEQRKKGAANP